MKFLAVLAQLGTVLIIILLLSVYTSATAYFDFLGGYSIYSTNKLLNWLLLYSILSISNRVSESMRKVSALDRFLASVGTVCCVCVFTAVSGPLFAEWADSFTLIRKLVLVTIINTVISIWAAPAIAKAITEKKGD